MSVTRTIPMKRDAEAARRQRPFDFLYDPDYTVSSDVDHARTRFRAYTSKDRVRKVPEFKSMFSSLPHHPRYTLKLDPADPVPASVDRRWQGHAEQHRQDLQQLACRAIPGAHPWLKREEYHVNGADLWKYFRRPLVPFGLQTHPDVIFALPEDDFESKGGKSTDQSPTHITVAVQTDYRESEAQTDPYSPEYILEPGTFSELLTLTSLTWGRGLPAGLAEVEMIERARAKRAWEATLPPLNDLSQRDKRRRMMEEMQAKEWAFRDSEIQRLQEARLSVLQELLRQRNEAQNEFTNDRLNRIYSELLKDREAKQTKLNTQHARSLKKLEAKRRSVEGKLERLGKDRKDFPLRVDLSRARTDPGANRSNKHCKELKSHYLHTHEGLCELESGLHASPLLRRWRAPKVSFSEDGSTAEDRETSLLRKYKALRGEGSQQVRERPLRFLVKREKPVPRAVTPKTEAPPEGEEEIELAAIHLQKLLRGRSVQYEMFKGKENHLELIRELRGVHALQPEEREQQRLDKELTMALKAQRDKRLQEICRQEASQARVVGAELHHLFDTLSKELLRLQEERRIHAFMRLAERERLRREAEESGRRQAEERGRKEDDEIFRQIVQVNQETVDLYFEDIILEATEKAADQQAREEIQRMAKEVNDLAYAMEEGRNELRSEQIVAELVYSFLIPEVEKMHVRQRAHQQKQKHLQAARSIILGSAESSGILPGPSQSVSPAERASTQVLKEMTSEEQKNEEEATQSD